MEPVLIGVLLDVSGSMKQNVGDGVDTEDGEWARSIFTVVDNLIKNDLKPNNHIFAIGFGASREADPEVFDLLQSVKVERIYPTLLLWDVVDKTLGILESNGASNVRKWAPKDTLLDALKGQEYKCDRILERLQRDNDFVRFVVNECLPSVCRDKACKESNVDHYSKAVSTPVVASVAGATGAAVCSFFGAPLIVAGAAIYPVYKLASFSIGERNLTPSKVIKSITDKANNMYSFGSSQATKFVTAQKKDIDDVVEKIEKEMSIDLKPVSNKSVFEVHAAHRILRGHVGTEKDLTKERIDKLMDKVRPYIYGYSPLNEALQRSAELFSQRDYCDHKKLLFVLSDGYPSDNCGSSGVIQRDITKVSCFITASNIDPYVLYSSATNTQAWERGPRFMFNLSSAMLTQNVPRTIFIKRKWKVEMINNETQLFLQVNHPDHLKGACDFAHEVVTSQEALSDVLTSVDLDIYINQRNHEFSAQDQEDEPTCYAHASATVMHLAMKRILGRDGGYPDFDSLRDEMINCYRQPPGGEQGANTEVVLQEMSPRYRLRCKKADNKEALRAIMEKRPVVARFRLTQKEWTNFKRFFHNDGKDILTSADVKTHRRKPDEKTTGHAVVLTSFNSKCLRFMNSCGTEWGDSGFFNVKDTDVLAFEFFDIYWNEEDLTPEEKEYYAAHGSERAAKQIRDLVGLQESTFACPKCNRTSKVTEFKGHLSNVTCPECKRNFKCGTRGNILAFYLYLKSLSEKNLKIRTAAISDSDESGSDKPDTPDECKHQ